MCGEWYLLVQIVAPLMIVLTMVHFRHDSALSIKGHRHDWEGIVVKWQKDPEGDWWHRAVRQRKS